MEEVLKTLKEMKDEMTRGFAEVKSEIAEVKSEMREGFARLDGEVITIKERLTKVEQEVQGSRTEFKAQKLNLEKCGMIYEFLLRQELRHQFGDSYVRRFKINNLLGLARAALPKHASLKDRKFVECSDAETGIQNVEFAQKLAEELEGAVEELKVWKDLPLQNGESEILSRLVVH